MKKNQRNAWISLFIMEVFATVLAASVFRLLHHAIAGTLAGGFFLIVGILAVFRFAKEEDVLTRAGLFTALIHLLGSTMLFTTRLSTPYDERVTSILGIPMEYFHKGSTYVFFFLMILTLIQVFRPAKQAGIEPKN